MNRLKSLREERGLNQQKIAMDLQVSQASISKYELGKAEPDIGTILKLAEYFSVSTDYLLGITEVKRIVNSTEFNDIEIEHISLYQSLNDKQKEVATAFVKGIIAGCKK